MRQRSGRVDAPGNGVTAMNKDNRSGPTPTRRSFAVHNRRDVEFTVVLEPWANEYPVRPGGTLEIVEEDGEPGAILEIGIESTFVVFYARQGSILRAYDGGEELP